MRMLKSVVGVIGALVPILYCGGLLYYFLDLSGSVQEAEANGLGPTMLGLAVVGLLFCIPLIMKVVKILAGTRSPGSGADTSTPNSEGGFDADAVLARYMARRSAEGDPGSPGAPPSHDGGGPAKRPGFGRKIK